MISRTIVGRIACNTLWLFLRTVLSVAIGGYIVRIVMNALGISTYGVYAAVMGVVTVFSTFNGILQDTARRFLGHALGRRDTDDAVRTTFAAVLFLTVLFCLAIVVLGETFGLAFVSRRLSFPDDLRPAVIFLYHAGLALMVFGAFQIPFAALIVVSERMAFFFWAGILDLGLSFVAALAPTFCPAHPLESYALALAGIGAVMLFVHIWICRRRFPRVVVLPSLPRVRFCEPGVFLSWSFLGAIGNVLKYQGVCLLVNHYAGAEMTASWKVALHVWGFLAPLGVDFQQAFCPQVFKSWAEGSSVRGRLVGVTLAVSVALTAVPVVVVVTLAPQIVSWWLGASAPPDAALFIRGFLIGLVFDAISQPLTTAIQASGRVALYQVASALISALGFVAAWVLLKEGLPAWTTVVAVSAVNGLGCLYRLFHVRVLMRLRLLS